MRILFLTPPDLKSHLYVLTPLAWALRTAGHEVRVASQPGLADGIALAGLTGVSVGAEMGEALEEVDEAEAARKPAAPRPPDRGERRLPVQSDYARDDPSGELKELASEFLPYLCPTPMLDDLVEFARAWQPDLVVWDALTYAGAVAARACGAAHARVLFGADALVQLRTAVLRQGGADDPMREWLQPTLERYGCEFGEDVVTGQWTIDTMPPWIPRPSGVHYVLMRHLSFNGPSIVPEWLYEKPARKRVCLTLGQSHRASGVAEASPAALLDAVADLDAEVVATFSAEQLDTVSAVPDNVRVVDFVPLNALLPTCSAVVHHGGAGASASAYEHGVPQLIVPSSYWSEKWFGPVAHANGVAEQGAGVYVAADSDELTADGLRTHLTRVLEDPSFAENAARIRTELMGLPTPNDLVPVLERLTAEHRGHRP